MNNESAWKWRCCSSRLLFIYSTFISVEWVKMTMANEKWMSEVKRYKSNEALDEKLTTTRVAKSKWNINVNINEPSIHTAIKNQHLPNKLRPKRDARPLLHENAIIMSKKSADCADKESNVRFGHFKAACGGEISLSNCRRFLSAAGVRSSRVCLRVKVCPVKLSRTGIDPRYHSNGTVIQLWTWWDRTALAGFLCVLKHKCLLLCFPSSIFNMQFKMYVHRVCFSRDAVVFTVLVYKNMPHELKRHTLSRHDSFLSKTLRLHYWESSMKIMSQWKKGCVLVFKNTTRHTSHSETLQWKYDKKRYVK